MAEMYETKDGWITKDELIKGLLSDIETLRTENAEQAREIKLLRSVIEHMLRCDDTVLCKSCRKLAVDAIKVP